MKTEKVLVVCPQCGHTQHEPAAAYSSNCKKCRHYFRLEDVLRPAAKTPAAPAAPAGPGRPRAEPSRELRQVTCFQCGTALEVSPSAQSTMCKRCSSHLDLRDYHISSAVSKNFRTRGRFVVEEGGYVFNTESVVAEAVIKGRFLGKLVAERSLEIHRSAEIKGTFKTGNLIIPATGLFRWHEPLLLGGADIAGEVVATVKAVGLVVLRSTARWFGDLEAGQLQVENGAVVVGRMKIGKMEPVNPLKP
ncbi:MAG TPA: polymer-forming cytoskeletal protein [Verrucomicrobiae bacterium]|nr:polymer-forming cytoskeletal protein [Verrucomicrobiae bacterium]